MLPTLVYWPTSAPCASTSTDVAVRSSKHALQLDVAIRCFHLVPQLMWPWVPSMHLHWMQAMCLSQIQGACLYPLSCNFQHICATCHWAHDCPHAPLEQWCSHPTPSTRSSAHSETLEDPCFLKRNSYKAVQSDCRSSSCPHLLIIFLNFGFADSTYPHFPCLAGKAS